MTDRKENVDERQVGIIGKYRVERVSDPTGKHDDCRYFVLDPQHDLIARRALAYYANDAREEGYTALADELEAWVRALWDAVQPCPSAVTGGRQDRCGLFSHPPRCSPSRCTMTAPTS